MIFFSVNCYTFQPFFINIKFSLMTLHTLSFHIINLSYFQKHWHWLQDLQRFAYIRNSRSFIYYKEFCFIRLSFNLQEIIMLFILCKILKELWKYNVSNRNRQKHNQVFKLLLFKINLKKNKFVSHEQYLLSYLFSRNARETHIDQSILRGFLLCLKRSDSQTFKCSRYNKAFFQYACYWYSLL